MWWGRIRATTRMDSIANILFERDLKHKQINWYWSPRHFMSRKMTSRIKLKWYSSPGLSLGGENDLLIEMQTSSHLLLFRCQFLTNSIADNNGSYGNFLFVSIFVHFGTTFLFGKASHSAPWSGVFPISGLYYMSNVHVMPAILVPNRLFTRHA